MRDLNQLDRTDESTAWFSDGELLQQVAMGSQEALKDLHQRYAPLIFNLASHSLDRPAAEEIVQDVFVALWRHADTFDPDKGTARNWILRIAHHQVINELRRRSRRPQALPDPDGQRLDSLPDSGMTPEEVVWQRYRRSTLRQAVNLLPPAQRQALSLAYFEELTHEQIADYLSLPLGTVKTRIRTAVQKLRVAMMVALVFAIVLASAFAAAVGERLRRQDRALDRDSQALQVTTSSDVTPRRLTPVAPGLPANAHANYRARVGNDVAVMTFDAFPPAPDGKTYQAWIRQDGAWHALSTVTPNVNGDAMLIISGHGVDRAPEGLEVTLEPTGGSQSPTGSVVVAWTP